MELAIITGISLIPNLINLYKLKGGDNMELIKELLLEIIVQIIFGGINEPLVVEKE